MWALGSRRPCFKCLLGSFPAEQYLDVSLNLPALINESNRSRIWYAESKYSKKWWLFKKKIQGRVYRKGKGSYGDGAVSPEETVIENWHQGAAARLQAAG